MSHFKERSEKVCLNCKAELSGRYCHVCGQENREPKETVWGLITHFFYDVTHFDGKFFSTTKTLIARPGLLPKEYINGRRASYINPIRMYIFSSAIFFIIFFSAFEVKNMVNIKEDEAGRKKDSLAFNLAKVKETALMDAETKEDSLQIEKAFRFTNFKSKPDSTQLKQDTVKTKKIKRNNWGISIGESNYSSRAEYDSVQKALPEAERDGWLKRRGAYRSIDLTNRYKDNEAQFWKDLMEKFLHTFPYLLFVSLPLYALFLKLLYIRRRRFYYVDHGIFLIYLYIFTFIFLLVSFGIDAIQDSLGWDWLTVLQVVFYIYGIYYAWRAMYKFYEQGRFKTFVKFVILNFLSFVSITLLFAIFFILTVFRI